MAPAPFNPGTLLTVRDDYRFVDRDDLGTPYSLLLEVPANVPKKGPRRTEIFTPDFGHAAFKRVYITPESPPILYLGYEIHYPNTYWCNNPFQLHLFLHEAKTWFTVCNLDFQLQNIFKLAATK